jgi:hypothetical protein
MESNLNQLHTPQRLTGESFDAYKTRRAQSHAVNKANRTIGQGGIGSRQQFRDSMRKSGAMGKRIRAYVALCAAWAQKRVTTPNTHGAITFIGGRDSEGNRRVWLGGISAQRGY